MRIISLLVLLFLISCAAPVEISRESKIPAQAVKITPEADVSPPVSKSAEYENPVPLPAPINTAGAEDSAFWPTPYSHHAGRPPWLWENHDHR